MDLYTSKRRTCLYSTSVAVFNNIFPLVRVPIKPTSRRKQKDEHLGLVTLIYLHFRELRYQLVKIKKDAKVKIEPASIAVSSIGDRYRRNGRIAQLLLKYQGSLRGLGKDELERKAQELAGQNTTHHLNLKLVDRRFHLLPCARNYWIDHLVHNDMVKNDKMKRLFLSCVDGGNDLAHRLWSDLPVDTKGAFSWAQNISNAIDWAIEEGHLTFFRLCVGLTVATCFQNCEKLRSVPRRLLKAWRLLWKISFCREKFLNRP